MTGIAKLSETLPLGFQRFLLRTHLVEHDPPQEESRLMLVEKYASDEYQYSATPRRWVVLVLYCLTAVMWSVFQFTYTAVADIIMPLFQIQSQMEFTMLMTMFNLFQIPFAFVSSFTMNRWGLRRTLLIGVIVQAAGSWLRVSGACSGRSCLSATYVGQAVCAASVAFLGPSVTGMLAANWFPSNERARVVSIGQIANTVGSALVLLLAPSAVVPGLEQQSLTGITVFQAVWASLCGGALVAVCTDFPVGALPSPAAAVGRDRAPESWHRMLVLLLCNRGFVLMCAMYAVGSATLATMPDVLQSVMAALGYDQVRCAGLRAALL
jgi:MFS family permease